MWREHTLNFEDKPSNVYICIDESQAICEKALGTSAMNSSWSSMMLEEGVDSTRLAHMDWYPRGDDILYQAVPSMGDGSLFHPMPKRYLPCSGVPLCQQ